MAYKVKLLREVQTQISSWGLPDPLLVEVYLRLSNDLSQNPMRMLRRVEEPFDGLQYRFSIVDISNRTYEHDFIFHAVYNQTEDHIVVIDGIHTRAESS